jgi:Zn-dependent protease with chaperone function
MGLVGTLRTFGAPAPLTFALGFFWKNMRVYLKLANAIIPLLLSACAALEATDKGLYAASNAVTQRDKITGARTISLKNRQQQIQQGNAAAEKAIEQARAAGKRINTEYSATAYNRIQRIFSRLQSISHVRDEKWTAVLIEDAQWNAYTTGGTYFVIYSSLEQDLTDDNELANVIAHEMAHTVANHIFEQQGYTQFSSLSKSAASKRGTFQTAFTHENEAEADKLAVLYCALAGFDPSAGARIWSRMYEKMGDNSTVFHDHPMNSERASLAQRTATLAEKYYHPDQINPEFISILENNDVFGRRATGEAEAGKGGGLLAILDTALTTALQRENVRNEEKRQQSRVNYLHAVNSLIKVNASNATGPNRWRTTVSYSGNKALTDIVVKLAITRAGLPPVTIIKRLNGVLQPSTGFSVEFESPELDAANTYYKNVYFIIENARTL